MKNLFTRFGAVIFLLFPVGAVLYADDANIGTFRSQTYGFELQFSNTYRVWEKSPKEFLLIENQGNIKRVDVVAQVLDSLTPSEIALNLEELLQASTGKILPECVDVGGPGSKTGCKVRTMPHQNQVGQAYLEIHYTGVSSGGRPFRHGPIFAFDLQKGSKDDPRTVLKVSPFDPDNPRDVQFTKGVVTALKFSP